MLITPLEGHDGVCGAIVLMRAGREREPYSDFDQALFRFLGFLLPDLVCEEGDFGSREIA